MSDFIDWQKSSRSYLAKVYQLLSTEMPDMETELIDHLRSIEGHYARVGCILAEANSWLDKETHRFYEQHAGQDLTVNEKKAKADSFVADVREMRNKVLALSDAIELRVNLAQSILKQQRGERSMSRG